MWEKGHSFEEIDKMSLEDYGDIIGSWDERARGEQKVRNRERALQPSSPAKPKGKRK